MMMEKRVQSFVGLGKLLDSAYGKVLIEEWAEKAYRKNNWFTPENTLEAIRLIISNFLDHDKLLNWVAQYNFPAFGAKKVGVIMAGNIPLVGFHDALAVLISGHILVVKLSSQDDVLIKEVFAQLLVIEPDFEKYIVYSDKMNEIDAIIATGSDNSSNYFEFYFKHIPRIIRKNRTSVAILKGTETNETMAKLGADIFQYYGLGCRNVSKIYVNNLFAPDSLYENIENWNGIMLNHKYKNNYDYNRSVLLVNQMPHFDNNFLMLKESNELVSPISVVFFEKYNSEEDLVNMLAEKTDKIQCVLSENGWMAGSMPIGEAQNPSLLDYADGVDTMLFLTSL